MAGKPVVPRDDARREIENVADFYRTTAGEARMRNFASDLEETLALISRFPAAGAPRYERELNWPGLRHRRLKRYPYLVFYVERESYIEMLHLLHGGRDIPASVREP